MKSRLLFSAALLGLAACRADAPRSAAAPDSDTTALESGDYTTETLIPNPQELPQPATDVTLPNYVGGIFLLIGYMMAGEYLEDLENEQLVGLLDAFGFGPYERGYVNPPVPFDRRGLAGVHRSGDYIKLAWLNKATLPEVTTRIYRSVTPLNGTPGPWTVIETYPPPTLPAGTSNVYTDLTPPNNSKNCYFIEVSDGFSTETTPSACTFTPCRSAPIVTSSSSSASMSRLSIRAFTCPSSAPVSTSSGLPPSSRAQSSATPLAAISK